MTETIKILDQRFRGSNFSGHFSLSIAGEIQKAVINVHSDKKILRVTVNDITQNASSQDVSFDVTGHVFNGDNSINVDIEYTWLDAIVFAEHHVWAELMVDYVGVNIPSQKIEDIGQDIWGKLQGIGITASILLALIIIAVIIIGLVYLFYGGAISKSVEQVMGVVSK